MNIGALALLLLVAAGAVVGVTMVFAKMPSVATTDSFGSTTSEYANVTQGNVTTLVTVGTSAGGVIVLLVGVLIVIASIIFFVAARHQKFSSRF